MYKIKSPVILNVNGIKKRASDISYDDLVWLYEDYRNKNGEIPTTNLLNAKNNLPQPKIMRNILLKNNMTYNEFMNYFGKVKHVRTESKDYELYLNKFKETVNKYGKVLTSKDLINNSYGLPSANWYVKYCPDNSVKSYDDFIIWCGYESNKLKKDDCFICEKLIQLEKDLNRPITVNDISLEKTGFSMIVINRIWGSLSNCKEDLGLMKSLPTQPKSFLYYRERLEKVLDNIRNDTTRNFISWKYIENAKYNDEKPLNHKPLKKAFDREGVDIFAFIKDKGFMMNPSNFSFHYTFDDGERVTSSMEYDFSYYLKNELNFIYKSDYQRDIMYKIFLPYKSNSKLNCDYVLNINDNNYYIEIAGIIKYENGDWSNKTFSSQKENDYRDKMILKKRLLESNNKNYLFLFVEDFNDDTYKIKFQKLINNECYGEVA